MAGAPPLQLLLRGCDALLEGVRSRDPQEAALPGTPYPAATVARRTQSGARAACVRPPAQCPPAQCLEVPLVLILLCLQQQFALRLFS